ncbi:hypothetical protein ACH5RR_035364 [Cinchona calisaya]|uniref:Uncharacterized protein n=1 Tax=Cinchona calisaya TaxID=153742 RepID=A0ABD2YEQ8_9GENT
MRRSVARGVACFGRNSGVKKEKRGIGKEKGDVARGIVGFGKGDGVRRGEIRRQEGGARVRGRLLERLLGLLKVGIRVVRSGERGKEREWVAGALLSLFEEDAKVKRRSDEKEKGKKEMFSMF